MNFPKSSVRNVAFLAIVTSTLAGCRNMNHTENGAVLGTGAGALAGAIIGHQTGNKEAGALIGALSGGAAGALIGKTRDTADQRDAALAHAHHQERMRSAEKRALTNRDIVDLAQNGFSDSHIIQTIQSRGGSFDLSTSSQIALSKSGVSEHVLASMERYNSRAY